MSETNFLESVLESEGVASEMLFNAKAARKEMIDRAKAQADEMIVNAKSQALENHRKNIADASEEADQIRKSVIAAALKDAEIMKVNSGSRSEQASIKTAEGIVKIFADS
jgi:vacuolar-type H+-ATPase subunit H